MAEKGRQYLLLADEDLMSLAGGGEAGAFAGLYDRHSRAAYSLAYRMVGEWQAAEDLVQEMFLDVWRAGGSYRVNKGSVRTWILSIIHNRGIDQLRWTASRRRTQERVDTAPTSQPREASTVASRNQQREQVREALRDLRPSNSRCSSSHTTRGIRIREIAELLGLPLGTGKDRMRLGLQKVRDTSAPAEGR